MITKDFLQNSIYFGLLSHLQEYRLRKFYTTDDGFSLSGALQMVLFNKINSKNKIFNF
jgi:hypothetical protein